MNQLGGKHIVITGAGGSIGSELCVQAIDQGASKLTLVSLTESALCRLERRLRSHVGSRKTELVSVLGSAGDRALMMEALAGADIVIHAAAHKHVPICESNPLAAIENNVGSTYTLAQVAAALQIAQFVLISSDKAVRPSSVMGATKRAAELVLRYEAAKPSKTSFMVVRFGNVLDSDGSVLPLWREQIARGGPLTLTDPDCERYFMSIPQACELVLGTIVMRPAGGTFVFDMGKPHRMMDLAYELLHQAKARHVEIRVVGLRPGEKLTEELHHGGELSRTAHEKIFLVNEQGPALDPGALLTLLGCVRNRNRERALRVLREIAA